MPEHPTGSRHRQLVARRVPECGWALYDARTDEKVNPSAPNAWWPTRKHAHAAREALNA